MKLFQLALYLSINVLFVAKYASRMTVYYVPLLVLYVLFVLFLVWLLTTHNYRAINDKIKFWLYIAASVTGGIGIWYLLHMIDPFSVQVDRWSAIYSFLQNLFAGKYPYMAITFNGNYPSPFPVWQFFHIPFYLLGDVGYGMLFCYIIVILGLVYLFNSQEKALIFLLLLIISPAFWYEVAVRSDLEYNSLLVFLFIYFIDRKKITLPTNVISIGIVCGLFLSTRVFVAIPIFLYLFRNYCELEMKSKIIFPFVILITFILTFLPFVFWNYNSLFFFQYNPFILQSRQGAPMEQIFLIAIAIFLGLKWKTIDICMSYASILLVLTVIIAFVYRAFIDHFTSNLFSVLYDISYFNMAMPFIIAYMVDHIGEKSASKPIKEVRAISFSSPII